MITPIPEPDDILLANRGTINRYETVREPRQCLACGHSRRVSVHVTHYDSGQVTRHWQRFCTACAYLARAIDHEQKAREFREKARVQKAKQKRSGT